VSAVEIPGNSHTTEGGHELSVVFLASGIYIGGGLLTLLLILLLLVLVFR
jgi:hypothetical protein